MPRLRVASAQYFIRPVKRYEEFEDQVTGLVQTARGYGARLVVFPEYFTIQLLTLKDYKRPVPEQIRDLATAVPRFVETMSRLARANGTYILAGTIPVLGKDGETLTNEAFFFSPRGEHAVQGKMHMTRFESEHWGVSPFPGLRVFETDLGNVAVLICYDVEFPELAREAARRDVYLMIVPSCTDDRNGFLRVRYCAHARCVENQVYVVHSGTVGSLPMVPAVSLNYGQAAILTPCDYPFAREGILFEGIPNQEMLVIGDLNVELLQEARERGTVLPLRDSQRSREVASALEMVALVGARA
jgi:predicted amidohydrolase